ncbi:ABC transporter permease [Dethiobacter alkaliphilus]|uniref:ABC transporter permease n=1 Tax=Dethiobacter alkaliphilus TaxID=427926 RepID=UPI002225CA59|nr:proline/glycine betaine ABC transporter permease [Dethiobacter alkaliphilus]MCW3490880.1 proline/glycine betaine ABC transporter permease [Dethiobacter alkaliphilus]
MPRLPIGEYFTVIVNFLRDNFDPLFSAIREILAWISGTIIDILDFPPYWVIAILIALLAYKLAGKNIALFSLLAVFLIEGMELWPRATVTLSQIITATIIALLIGVPTGILAAKFDTIDKILRPVLDLMQTMPAFVYLIPAAMFFRLGTVPAIISTIIFSMPPAIRLTNLGIRQVPKELVEAGESFGSTWQQMLFKVQLPQALPTIMAGVNQCIMLALSMVVIASMIGAGGLGSVVLTGVGQLNVGMSFEGGLAVVVIAIVLDRLTQGANKKAA